MCLQRVRQQSTLGCCQAGTPSWRLAVAIWLCSTDPATTATFLSRYRPTVVDTFPNLYIRWEQFANDARGPLSNVRFFLSTFDAVHPGTIQRLLASSKRRF